MTSDDTESSAERVLPEQRVGAAMREAREAARISLRGMAKRLGYHSHTTFSSYERGEVMPTDEVVKGYERILGLASGTLTSVLEEARIERHGDPFAKRRQRMPVDFASKEQDSEGTLQDTSRSRWFHRRSVILVAGVLVLAIGATIWFANKSNHQVDATHNAQAATCADVGNDSRGVLDRTWAGPFRAAYQGAGGKAKLGCPRTDDPSGFVHQWGAGTSQDLQGGRASMARIMALDPKHVIVMAGSYWQDYTDLGSGQPNSNAAQQEGYPTSDPFTCGQARLVLLANSQHNETPGIMVTAAHSVHFIWLPKPIWLAYKTVAGPFGPLGQPTGEEQPIQSGIRQPFEHGDITLIGDATQTNIHGSNNVSSVDPNATVNLDKCIERTKS